MSEDLLSPKVAALLDGTGLSVSYVAEVAQRTLVEDLFADGSGGFSNSDTAGVDVTTAAIFDLNDVGAARVTARAGGVAAGLPIAAAVFDAVSAGALEWTSAASDGDRVVEGQALATLVGPVRLMLTAERSALNMLCRLSGVATATAAWVDAVAGTGVVVLDTRKTTPGLRALEKYAVRCGGGANKRFGLHDVAMIKDNHIAAAGSVSSAYAAVRRVFPDIEIQVEVEDVKQAEEAVAAGAQFLLCDNMSPQLLSQVVAAVPAGVELEATGGLTLRNARAYAETGVTYLSVGALTHSAPILDIALDM